MINVVWDEDDFVHALSGYMSLLDKMAFSKLPPPNDCSRFRSLAKPPWLALSMVQSQDIQTNAQRVSTTQASWPHRHQIRGTSITSLPQSSSCPTRSHTTTRHRPFTVAGGIGDNNDAAYEALVASLC